MDLNGRLADFDLEVNPYDFLNVPRGCTDLKLITKAYHKKSLLLHPDKRKGNEYDFSTLNKCYIYLKTLIQELHGTGASYMENLEDRMRELQRVRLDTEQKYERMRKDPIAGNGSGIGAGNVMAGSGMVGGEQGSIRKGGKIDFTKQLRVDNCIIGADQFDENVVYNEMMRNRPMSTSYRDLDVPTVQNPFPNKKYNRDQFNQLFMENMAQQRNNFSSQDPFCNIDGFTGFDDLCGASSVVSDGRFMFVQGHVPTNMGSHSTTTSSYGFLEQFQEYDMDLERQRFQNMKSLDGKVTDADVRKFTQMLEKDTPQQQRISRGQFNERMIMMETQFQDRLQQQKQVNRDVVDAQIARLTDATKSNLFSNLRITDRDIPLSKDQEKRFAFPGGDVRVREANEPFRS